MMKLLVGSCFILCMALLSGSCAYNSEEALYGDQVVECDTLGMSFADDIFPIIQGNCNTPLCHVAGGSAAGIFENYAGIKEKVDNGTMALRVVDLKDMPPAAPITDCQRSKIAAWINDGAPDN